MDFVLDLSGFDDLDKELEIIANTTIKVGVLGEDKVDGVSVQEYAIWNEYGTIYIPSRPFFRVACMSRKAQREIKAYMNKRINLHSSMVIVKRRIIDLERRINNGWKQ